MLKHAAATAAAAAVGKLYEVQVGDGGGVRELIPAITLKRRSSTADEIRNPLPNLPLNTSRRAVRCVDRQPAQLTTT